MPFQKNDPNINRKGRPPSERSRAVDTIYKVFNANIEGFEEELNKEIKLGKIKFYLKYVYPILPKDIAIDADSPITVTFGKPYDKIWF